MKKIDFVLMNLQNKIVIDYFHNGKTKYEKCTNTKELLMMLDFKEWEDTLSYYGYSNRFIQTEVKNQTGRFVRLLNKLVSMADDEYNWGDEILKIMKRSDEEK